MLKPNFPATPIRLVCLLFVSAIAVGCGDSGYARIDGQTMGTYFAVKYQMSEQCNPAQSDFTDLLDDVNASMSTYISDSELSRFNAIQHTEWVAISPDLEQVLMASHAVWRQSGGAFDVTVGPLVDLWGFGPNEPLSDPGEAARQAAAANVGMQKLEFRDGAVRKLTPGVSVDLSALAKGFGVDVLARHLLALGCRDFLVDIGGEIRSAGVNEQGASWRVGVEQPTADQLGGLHAVLQVSDMAVATSGDYRNFRMVNGRRVDHVLDPRIGEPADNTIVSSTVIHPSAMWADAYATALMVLGWDDGFRLADQLGLPVYLIRRTGDNTAEARFESRYNAPMREFIPQQ